MPSLLWRQWSYLFTDWFSLCKTLLIVHILKDWYDVILSLLVEDLVTFLDGVGMHSGLLYLLFSPLDLFLDKGDKVLTKFQLNRLNIICIF